MELLKPHLKYVHTLVHPAFLYLAIAYVADRPWMPLLLIVPYTFFAYITLPGLKPKFDEMLVWFFGLPLITAVCGFWALKLHGMPDDPAVVALIIVVFVAYIYANIIALGARAIPELFSDQNFRRTFKKQPIGFMLLFLIAYVCLLTFFDAM